MIETVDGDGLGMATVGDRRLRVKNALPGELAQARILKRRSGEWLAEAHRIDSASPDRTRPACPYYPRCGGCVLQHLETDRQMALKTSRLLGLLSHQGVTPERVNDPTLGPRYHYRSKARFGVRVVGGQVLVGFRETFSNRVGRMASCLTLTTGLARLPGALKGLIAGLSAPHCIPQVEVAEGTDACAMILRHLEPFTEEDRRRIEAFSKDEGVRCYGQSGGYETVEPLSTNARERYLGYANSEFGLHFLFDPRDFTQVNLEMNTKLVRAAVTGLNAPGDASVLDLFCGIGNFSLALASAGCRVRGVEASQASIDRAAMNACHNGLERWCEFAQMDLYDADCLEPGLAAFMVLDPPRSGAGPNLSGWLRSAVVERVAYVSCSPESFASDAGVLCRAGFSLEQVGIFDMFPHTAHVETLGIFQRR